MDIKKLRVDSKAQNEGARVDCVRFQWPNIYITTRSLRCAAFTIENERLQAKRLREKRLDESLPARERRALSDRDREECHREAMISKCLIDVEGFTEDGKPLSFREICDRLSHPDYAPLAGLCTTAALSVGFAEDDPFEEDLGNSSGPSGGSSATDAPPISSGT